MEELEVVTMASAEHKPACRGCDHGELELVIDLGRVPLANSLLTEEELSAPEDRFPLQLYFCPSCKLVQIGETVIPTRLFSQYLYASSFSDSMLEHVRRLVTRMVEERRLDSKSLVIEIASNDGYLLQYYLQRQIPVLGIEPAQNIAEIAKTKRGVPTLVEFFGPELAERLAGQGQQADVIHAHNVFAHVPRPGDFLAGLKRVLKLNGAVVIEVPYLGDLIRHLEFDTIYHEHFSYFSLTAVEWLARQHGLMVSDVERIPIHGGSLRLFLSHADAVSRSTAVTELLAQESADGMTEWPYYGDFARRVSELKRELNALLLRLKQDGCRLAAYGASAKGSTLMNAFGIGKEQLDFVVDRSTLKQGRFTPGNHLPILAPETLLERRPDYALLLTWNFADEILQQQKAYRDAGGRFIVPLPQVKVV